MTVGLFFYRHPGRLACPKHRLEWASFLPGIQGQPANFEWNLSKLRFDLGPGSLALLPEQARTMLEPGMTKGG